MSFLCILIIQTPKDRHTFHFLFFCCEHTITSPGKEQRVVYLAKQCKSHTLLKPPSPPCDRQTVV